MALDGGSHPDLLAGLGIKRRDASNYAEFATRHAGDDQPLGDDRHCGDGVAFSVVTNFLFPDHLAGVLVQRHQN